MHQNPKYSSVQLFIRSHTRRANLMNGGLQHAELRRVGRRHGRRIAIAAVIARGHRDACVIDGLRHANARMQLELSHHDQIANNETEHKQWFLCV